MEAMGVADGDLRKSSQEDFFKNLHEAMGQNGLLTYRYLGRRSQTIHKLDYEGMLIRRDMRNASGGLKAAPLAIASAEAGGWTDYTAVPAPILHSISLLDAGRDIREIRINRTRLRVGKTMGFTSSTIVDEADPGRVLATTHGIGVKLGDAPPAGEGADKIIEIGEQIPDSPALPPLHEVFGGYHTAEGKWALPRIKVENRSTLGTLHLGPMHIIFEAAADELAEQATGTNLTQIEQWDVMFIAPGLVGPFVVTGEVDTGNLGRTAVRMKLHDEGSGDRLIAFATAVYRLAG
jgi:hypothetical protein